MNGFHIVPTAIRQAFNAIIVKPSAATNEGKRIAGIISDKMHENKGMVGYYKCKDWNAHLSFETFKQLQQEGVM